MSTKLFDATLTAAQLQALTVNRYYWIDKNGGTVDTTQSTLTANATVPQPSDLAMFEVSMFQAVEMYTTHGALTSEVGGKLSIASLSPDGSLGASAGTVPVFGATIDQALAATAESLITSVVNPPTAARTIKVAIAILFTTAPTAGTGLRVSVWGHRDGQERARG